MSSTINHWVRIKERLAVRDGRALLSPEHSEEAFGPDEIYRDLQFSYPKFFKMDVLCKWAWIGAECLLRESERFFYEGIDKNKVAVVLATSKGCLDVDKKYQQSILSIPSPSLFVYTLSNIMLGEICIRHGFKGEQACFVNEAFNGDELFFWVNDLLRNGSMEACLCGWVDAANYQHDVSMFWVSKHGNGLTFSSDVLQQVHNSK